MPEQLNYEHRTDNTLDSLILYTAQIVSLILRLLAFCILGRSLISWVPNLRDSEIARALDNITDPILQPLRRIIPAIGGTFDITPMLAMLALFLISDFIRSAT